MSLPVLFWTAVAVVVYTYLGYGLIAGLLARVSRGRATTTTLNAESSEPHVALVIAAYNEKEVVLEKVRNCLELDYPSDKLDVLFVTDGSDDGTPAILKTIDGIRVSHKPERAGKIGAMNRAMTLIEAPIVIFSDANAMLNREAIRRIVGHYADPRVGGVAGEKCVQSDGSTPGDGEGFYWRYESALKRFDSEIGSVVGAAGELFSIRSKLFCPVEPDTILDDFVISLRVIEQGYTVRYEPGATASEGSSASVSEELKRKIRICAGGFQSIVRLPSLLNPFKHGIVTWQYISHRVLRWTLAPACLLILFVAGIALTPYGPVYQILFGLQSAFYLLAAAGWYTSHRETSRKWLLVPFYFTFMNLASFAGLYRFLRGGQSVLWEKAARA